MASSREIRDGINDSDIAYIGDQMDNWEALAVHFNLTRPQQHAIKRKYPSDPQLQPREMLYEWRRKRGSDATIAKLVEILETKAKENDLAHTLKLKYNIADIPSNALDLPSSVRIYF